MTEALDTLATAIARYTRSRSSATVGADVALRQRNAVVDILVGILAHTLNEMGGGSKAVETELLDEVVANVRHARNL